MFKWTENNGDEEREGENKLPSVLLREAGQSALAVKIQTI